MLRARPISEAGDGFIRNQKTIPPSQ
jgi:hypothetical protein